MTQTAPELFEILTQELESQEGEEVDLFLFGGHHCTTQLRAFSKRESGTYLVLQGCDDGNYLMR